MPNEIADFDMAPRDPDRPKQSYRIQMWRRTSPLGHRHMVDVINLSLFD